MCVCLFAGSELDLAYQAQEKLVAEGHKVRLVSMPCWEIFEEQSAEYKESVLPKVRPCSSRLGMRVSIASSLHSCCKLAVCVHQGAGAFLRNRMVLLLG